MNYGTNGKFTIKDTTKVVSKSDKEMFNVKGRTVKDVVQSYVKQLEKDLSMRFRDVISERLALMNEDEVNTEFQGEVWTDRETKHMAQYDRDINAVLYAVLFGGIAYALFKQRAAKELDRYYRKEKSLMITERAYRMTLIDTTGYSSWTFVANPLACPDCVPLDGKTFPINTLRDNFPKHVNCRCSFKLNK